MLLDDQFAFLAKSGEPGKPFQKLKNFKLRMNICGQAVKVQLNSYLEPT